MANIEAGRKTTTNDQDLVVFLIGARINKWWLLPLSLPLLSKMRKMQQELLADPDSGLLGIQSFGTADVQYWRSLDDLQRYAEDRDRTHKRTATKFFQKIFRNQAIGVWHETYCVQAGAYESLFVNMPAQGIGKVKPLIDASGPLAKMRGRLQPASRA